MLIHVTRFVLFTKDYTIILILLSYSSLSYGAFKYGMVPTVPLKTWKRPKMWMFSDLVLKCKECC